MKSDKQTDQILQHIYLHELPAQGSTSDYHKAINAALALESEFPPCLSKPYIARALQRAGFVPIGRDKHGCMLLHNPHHNPKLVMI